MWSRTSRIAILVLAAGVLSISALTASAAPGLSRPLYLSLNQVHERLREGRAQHALQILERVGPQAQDDYARAVVKQTYGYVWLELARPALAAKAFEQALALDVLPAPVENDVRYNLAGILARLGRTAKAVDLLEAYLEGAEAPPLQARTLLARLYLDRGRYRAAVTLLEGVRGQLQRSDETVLLLLVAGYGELRQEVRTVALLAELVRISPGRAEYWDHLAATHLALGREDEALVVLELAYLQGLADSPAQLRLLAQLYIREGVPYKAGRLIEREIRNGRLQADGSNGLLAAQAWQMAREHDKAVEALTRVAATRADPGLHERLAGLHAAREAWGDAARELEKGIGMTAGQQRNRMLITLGAVRFQQGQREQARAALLQVSRDSREREQAERWLRYLGQWEAAAS